MALPAYAENCAPRDIVVERLASQYGETRRSRGVTPTSVVEVFASDKTGTWTIIVTSVHGISCLVSVGTDYEGGQAQGSAL